LTVRVEEPGALDLPLRVGSLAHQTLGIVQVV
jgi:hypothetical protein